MHTVLFVCTGNTCRSPLAEGIASAWLAQQGFDDWLAASAGTAGFEGMPPSRETVTALANRGISLDGNSTALSEEMVQAADIVFCMTQGHLRMSLEYRGNAQAPIIELLDPEGDITDPIGSGESTYEGLAARFEELIPRRMEEVMAHAQ